MTTEERSGIDLGHAARKRIPRSRLGLWEAPENRLGAVEILEAQSENRIPELVPVRYGRMLVSPFAFFRGAAAVMARDLASTPHSGLMVQLCGDAHLANFGVFASPERRLRFGINDFDETLPGPFEWDVKRLVASVDLVARELGLSSSAREAARLAVGQSYQSRLAEFVAMRDIDLWYYHIEEPDIMAVAQRARAGTGALRRFIGRAYSHTNLRALNQLGTRVDGHLTIRPAPPLVVPADQADVNAVAENLEVYLESLPPENHLLVGRYRLQDVALKVVGVGSVGTRCWLALMVGRDEQDPLFLQIKEATQSVLEPYLGQDKFTEHGARVVVGQKLIQSSSDISLGWGRGRDGRDYYVRQLWDLKGNFNPLSMSGAGLRAYAGVCAWELARAHGRTGNGAAIKAYIGNSDRFARAIARFGDEYGRQTILDYRALAEAERAGRIKADHDT